MDKPYRNALAAGLLLVLAACAALRPSWDDPAVKSLRISVSRDLVADPPELETRAGLLRTLLVAELGREGFDLPGAAGPDGVLHVSLSATEAAIAFTARNGEAIDVLRAPLRSEAEEEALARELVYKLEHSTAVQFLARTGLSGPLPP